MSVLLNSAYSSLDLKFQPIVKEILEKLSEKGYEVMVCEGRRTKAQQAEKVRLGYSKTMNSYHLSGLAADIVDKRYMWNIAVTHKFWVDYGTVIKSIKAPAGYFLRWGGDWNVPGRFEALKAGKPLKYEHEVKGVKYYMDNSHLL